MPERASRADGNSSRPCRKNRSDSGREFKIGGNSRRSKNSPADPLDHTAISSVNVGPSPQTDNTGNSAADYWLSTEEVSKRLKIPEKTLANWASLGKGPRYARMGRYRRYRFSDLIDWEEAQLEHGQDM
ncbi:helix-turn-helix domain-containing protein [Nocardia vinacea]|uniref:helix-turn-helix domain-containing protein n=1 Tax=Nocardia vinacea TaxID=96468 RepID=UPI000A05DA24|nr:helix-turn-helix domain-containing protein [Nocardia vinacea]